MISEKSSKADGPNRSIDAEKNGSDFSQTWSHTKERTSMTTSPRMPRLSEPTDDVRISPSALAYLQSRTKLRLFDLVHKKFNASKLTQAQLAKRLGKGTDRICKLLGAPGNWTLDTVSDLLFAIDGGVLDPQVDYPMKALARNDRIPHWVERDFGKKSTSSAEIVRANFDLGRTLASTGSATAELEMALESVS